MPIIISNPNAGGSGAVATASEGLQIIGTDVQMGGNPIDKTIGIEMSPAVGSELTIGDPINIWGFDISGAPGADPADLSISLSAADDGILGNIIASYLLRKTAIQSLVADAILNKNTSTTQQSGGYVITLADIGSAQQISLTLQNAGAGVVKMIVTDTNHLGLQKDATVQKAVQLANQSAYVTTDCLGAALLGTVNTALQVIAGTFSFGNIGATNQLVRVNGVIFINSVGTGCIFTFSMTYTDINNATRTNTLATVSTTTPAIVPPQVIYAKAGTGISLNVAFGGTADGQYHVFGSLEYLGVQN